jgi:hypothetical protein
MLADEKVLDGEFALSYLTVIKLERSSPSRVEAQSLLVCWVGAVVVTVRHCRKRRKLPPGLLPKRCLFPKVDAP